MTYLLAADIGGTKTNLAIFVADQGLSRPMHQVTLANLDYESFAQLLTAFLQKVKLQPDRACFGVAGPVLNNRVKLTNLPWEIVGSDIAEQFALDRVDIINDLVAVAGSLPHLTDNDLLVLQRGTRQDKGALGVVAPGTGLGIAFCIWDGSGYMACPSEGGHAAFSPANYEELELLGFLLNHGISPSFESLCSGSGLPNIYRFLIETGGFAESDWLRAELHGAVDPTPVIVQAALGPGERCPICFEAMRLFTGILAEACGNLAVTVFATGGIYIGGGIPLRILSLLQHEDFVKRFASKGKMSGLVADIPISVIINPKAALIGAAAYGLRINESK
ncbi:MAG: glucokinase [Proteobacteria bacterium]|nr:glucokinase [Pseudomonadota bacterium]MBU4295748.1 glucokinase [Pseudomonadota bacterium]MCG2747167.1 glucokinase [Desulfobulbaceae bacterium]